MNWRRLIAKPPREEVMRLSSLIPATLLVVLNYGVAVAQQAPSSADYWMPGCRDAAALIHFSNDGDSSDLVKVGFCVGIIDGISYRGASSGLCVPVGVTAQQAVRVVVQYIDGQAITRVDEDFRLLAFEALQTAWPCKN
jgi:hypothetical protein